MKKRLGTLLAFAASLSLIAVGLLQGQNKAVFTKAVKICLECIGIG